MLINPSGHSNIALLLMALSLNGLRNEGESQISNKVHRFQTAFDNDRGYETQAHAVFYDVYAREVGLGVRMSLLCVGLRLDMRICRC
jgi:hypothetical protein